MNLNFVKKELQPGTVALVLYGSVYCGEECTQMETEVNRLIAEKQTRLVFDLSHVTTMDSAAIGSVVRCFRKLRAAGGDLRLAGAPPVIARILDQTKVNKIVPTHATVDEAVASFSSKA